MSLKFKFKSSTTYDDGEKASWEGNIELLSETSPLEAEICARGSSFHLVIGKHSFGRFLCIPNWNIGTEIASLGDRFWNKERLQQVGLSQVDACSIADALVILSKHINF